MATSGGEREERQAWTHDTWQYAILHVRVHEERDEARTQVQENGFLMKFLNVS